MVIDTSQLLKDWKSTIGGLLTTSLATSAAFLAPPLNTLVSPKVVLWVGGFQAIAKIWIALITKDAGTEQAFVPGKGIQNVPSHEVPDQEGAVAVK